jgi:glycosyltransferase involved in cell wall biosynthesis
VKLIYIARARIPTEKAHGLQIMKMCEAFAKQGVKVELVISHRIQSRTLKNIDAFEYYGVEQIIRIIRLPVPDLIYLQKFLPKKINVFHIHDTVFSLFALFYSLLKNPDVIFTRDSKAAFLLSFFKPVIYETHTFSRSKIDRFFEKKGFKRFRKVVAITKHLKNVYIDNGFASGIITVLPDGVDLEMFDIQISKADARTQLGLEEDEDIILYTGHLYPWKGAHTLLEASKRVTGKIVIVGGLEEDVKAIKDRVEKEKRGNVQIVGHVNPNLIPIYLKAADVLVLPNSTQETRSKFYTSPLKLFEYMASKRPIVASDLPSIREILNKDNAVLVMPDQSYSLAEGISMVLGDEKLASKISDIAFNDVKEHTWVIRVSKILKYYDKSQGGISSPY